MFTQSFAHTSEVKLGGQYGSAREELEGVHRWAALHLWHAECSAVQWPGLQSLFNRERQHFRFHLRNHGFFNTGAIRMWIFRYKVGLRDVALAVLCR